jgi:hypothetical protein
MARSALRYAGAIHAVPVGILRKPDGTPLVTCGKGHSSHATEDGARACAATWERIRFVTDVPAWVRLEPMVLPVVEEVE